MLFRSDNRSATKWTGSSRKLATASGLIVALLAGSPAAVGQTWNAATGTWNNAANWTGGIPASGATTQLTFNSSDATGYTTTNDIGTGTFTLNRLTVNNTGTGTVTINGAAAANTFTFAGATPTIDIQAGTTLFNGLMIGTATVTKTGAGTFIHDSNNTGFTGTLIVNAGTFINRATTVATTNFNPVSIVVNNGGTYQFGAATVGDPNLPNTTYITVNTGGTVRWEEGETYGGFILDGGAINLAQGGMTLAGTTASIFRSGTVTGANNIGGATGIDKTTSGTVTITGSGLTTTGTINLQDGVLATNGALSNTGNLVFGTTGVGATTGTLRFTGTTTPAAAISKPIVLNAGGGVIDVTDAGVNFPYSGVATGTGPFTKAGAGGLIVTGNNTYTGLTTVAGGTMQIGNGGTAGSIASAVSVSSGATLAFNRSDNTTFTGAISGQGNVVAQHGTGATITLSGPLSYTGQTTVASGGLRVTPFAANGITVADSASFGIVYPAASTPLTTTTLALGTAGATTLALALNTSTNPTLPLINVTNTDGLTLNTSTHALTVSNTQGLSVGTIPLIKYAGADITSGFTLADLPARTVGNLQYDTGNKQINLVVTAVDSIIWAGNVSSTWDAGTAVGTGGTNNFVLNSNTATATNFVPGDIVRFDDTAAVGSRTVTIPAALAPSQVTVNTTGTYTFTGAGNLTGGTNLIKQGTGELIIATNNDNTGGTTISAGTLRVGTGGTTGSIGTGDVVNNGQLFFNRSDDTTVAGSISGTGSLTKQGAGTLTVAGSYTISGDTNIAAGALALASNNSFSYAGKITGAGSLTKSGSSVVTISGANDYTGGTTVTAGTLNVGNGGTSGAIGGNLTLTATGATLAFNRSDSTTYAGNISITGGLLTHTGTGTTTLTGTITQNATNNGAISAQAGTLVLANPTTTGLIGTITAGPAGTITFDTTSGPQVYINIFAGSGNLRKVGTNDVTLTANNSFTGTLTIDSGKVILSDQNNNGGDFNATSIVVNNGGTFQFGENGLGNPDLPNTTYITVNAGGTAIWEEGEDFGGFILNGGTLNYNLVGGNNLVGATPTEFRSGSVITPTNLGPGGTQAINKTTAGTVVIDKVPLNNTGGVNIQQGVIETNAGMATAGALTFGTNGTTGTTSGTLRYTGATATLGKAIIVNDGGGTIEVTNAATSYTLSGAISGAGPLIKLGAGSLIVIGSSTATGSLTVSAGSLVVNNTTGTGTGTGPVTVATAATLGGSGTIGSNLSINGTLAPGNSPGKLTAASDVTLGATSMFSVELGKLAADSNPPAAGTDYDQLSLTTAAGQLTITGGARLGVTELANLAPGQVFTIVDNVNAGTLSGTFSDLAGAPLPEGATVTGNFGSTFTISYLNNDVTLTAVNVAVPEPTAIGLLGAAAAGLLVRRRRNAR